MKVGFYVMLIIFVKVSSMFNFLQSYPGVRQTAEACQHARGADGFAAD